MGDEFEGVRETPLPSQKKGGAGGAVNAGRPQQSGQRAQQGRGTPPPPQQRRGAPPPQQAGQQRRGTPPPRGQRPQNGAQNGVPRKSGGQGAQNGKKKAKKNPILLLIIFAILIVAVVVIIKKRNSVPVDTEPVEVSYGNSGKATLDALMDALHNYDATVIDGLVGVEDGDSYLAQEWAYVNGVPLREEYIQKICSLVVFQYPQVDGMDSLMNNGETMQVTLPDYPAIIADMDSNREYIVRMFESAGYSEADYTWRDEMVNLLAQYVCDMGVIPVTQVEMSLPVRLSTGGTPYIESDALLDDALFGSDSFHDMCAKFSQLCFGWTGFKDEAYKDYELQHNPEYDAWLDEFLVYFEADGGVYDKETDTFSNVQEAYDKHSSKWEPWFLRNDQNEIQTNPDGTYIVNYFSVKDKNGKDWIQPDEKIEVEVDAVRQVEDPWVEEAGVVYSWIGMNFIQNRYHGVGDTVTRVGDGSFEHPAGIGTTIITKVLCTDGKYHDVKVAMVGYWTEQDAIDYAERFSTKNHGFTTSAVVQLICYEISVENLESQPIEFKSSEMTLTDRNSNISPRTGTMYGFSDLVTLAPRYDASGKDKVIINDWANSTELAQKYPCWGKSFGRTYSMVYFACLAGTGDVPTYSAYEQFTGTSRVEVGEDVPDSGMDDLTTSVESTEE